MSRTSDPHGTRPAPGAGVYVLAGILVAAIVGLIALAAWGLS